MKAIGTVLNPVGAIAEKVGGTAGKILDPVSAISKAAGGHNSTMGSLIDPAGAMRTQQRRQASFTSNSESLLS